MDLGKLSLRKVRFRLPAQDDSKFLVLVELNNKSELSSGVSPRVKSSTGRVWGEQGDDINFPPKYSEKTSMVRAK